MSETIKGLKNELLKWKQSFESKGLKANFGETKVKVSSSITKYGMSKRKVDPYVVCSLGVKATSVMC